MDALQRVAREAALRKIPDTPATLEFRDVAIDAGSTICRSGDGMLLVHSRGLLVGATGPVRARDLDRVYPRSEPDCELLADRAAYERLRERYAFERAVIHTLAWPWQPRDRHIAGFVVRPLEASDSLAHLPAALRRQISRELSWHSVIAGFIDRCAVSFAYCAARTETWGDISIDTLEAHRGRGLGAVVASALIDRMMQEGRAPVWGAVEDNHASLRLAEKLGFTRPAGELFVYEP